VCESAEGARQMEGDYLYGELPAKPATIPPQIAVRRPERGVAPLN
jgi:hypothetical protein